MKADLFIDDRNVGGLPDWGVIYEMVHNKWRYDRYLREFHREAEPEKVSFWGRLFGGNKKQFTMSVANKSKAGCCGTFLNDISYRESCYNCKFAQLERVSDITIGDF